MTTHTSFQTASLTVSQRIAAGLLCAVLGFGVLFAVGFADMAVAHNAAHDTRHAIGFPCH